jgi:hypothetical protein
MNHTMVSDGPHFHPAVRALPLVKLRGIVLEPTTPAESTA